MGRPGVRCEPDPPGPSLAPCEGAQWPACFASSRNRSLPPPLLPGLPGTAVFPQEQQSPSGPYSNSGPRPSSKPPSSLGGSAASLGGPAGAGCGTTGLSGRPSDSAPVQQQTTDEVRAMLASISLNGTPDWEIAPEGEHALSYLSALSSHVAQWQWRAWGGVCEAGWGPRV